MKQCDWRTHVGSGLVRKLVPVLMGVVALLGATPSFGKTKSNTQERLPDDVFFGDVNGDRSVDFLEINGGKMVSRRTDFGATVITDDVLDLSGRIIKVFTGDFAPVGRRERGKDQVCAVFADASLKCWAISDDGRSMWWWFTQGSFIAANEEAMVGDFNGDGRQDVMVYRPSDGNLRLYTLRSDGFFFDPLPFTLGNLSSLNRANKQIRVGEFGQSSSRSDLLIIDPATRSIYRYDTAIDASGNLTFWWAFTASSFFSSSEDVTVANVAGQTTDDIVYRNRSTGAYRFTKAAVSGGTLTPITNVSVGQLPTTANGRVYWAKAGVFSETGNAVRDDAFYISNAWLVRTDARWSGSQLTYWWAYSKPAPRYTRMQRTLYDLSAAQRTELSNHMRAYITESIISEHANGHDWHHPTSESFFYQHRRFLTSAEKFLIGRGASTYVPMPMWDPNTVIPSEFTWVKANANGMPRPPLTNLDPRRPIPSSLSGGNVCSFSNGTSLVQATNSWHGGVHIAIGGTMADAAISPAAVIFWPWHAFVDNIYARWHDCF